MVKTLILLRHGQYTKEPSEKLTALGRKQAALAGKRLKSFKIDRVFVSTMPRAQETSTIALNKLNKKLKPQNCDYLRECVPGFPLEKLKKNPDIKKSNLKKDKLQADKAFKKYFSFSRKKSTDLLVCHGNIIRYLMCKSLDVKTINWTKFDIKQCGITIIELRAKDRSVKVIAHNDIGHIPHHMQTFM